jgi:dTDP-4-dehydrorhamnose reductase
MLLVTNINKRILVIGSSGMLGNAIIRYFSDTGGYLVTGTVRSKRNIKLFPKHVQPNIVSGIDIDKFDSIRKLITKQKPDIVINCVGLVKQLSDANDPLVALPINTLFPHKLARLCFEFGARLVHMSTDCVFSGSKGMYTENDYPDARDLYGVSKLIGEVDYSNAITLRTSIIGHELNGSRSLVDWFLSQNDDVKGFKRAIFSGLPTVEIARVISEFVIPYKQLTGVYHLSADPISKYDLLSLIAQVYKKDIKITQDNDFVIDRSLDSSRFRGETGYNPPSWESLICKMHGFR